MYLIVDFSDLNLDFTQTDIRFDEENADYTVDRFIKELCKGIETFGGETIPQKETVCLLDTNGTMLGSKHMVSTLCQRHWNDWDTIYLVRRRS